MKKLPYIGLVCGLALLIALLVWQGLGPVVVLLLDSGWSLLWLPIVWLPGLLVGGIGWWYLFPAQKRPGWRAIVMATWLGHAVNNLLPVASVGGDIARARLLQLWGHDGIEATASAVVDKTIQAVALMLWGLIGVGLLAGLAIDNQLATIVLAGFLILAACIATFILVQHAGMLGFMARVAERLFEHEFIDRLKDHAEQVDASIRSAYRRRRELALSIIWHTLGLILQTAEVWLGCYLLGHPIGLVEALLIKSLTSTISDIAFIIPNGYGIQEGAYIMIGTLVGLPPEFALALALAIRLRDLVIDLPGLLHWQTIESRQLLERQRNG
ncbi:MAG: flippase-like domain-containing protein [Gammaproteobacteria bacterium]|nr:flippase-like domain-containing protein [Gammaproteobacteria bacterium]